jgi:hypothetical protein
LTIAGGGVVAAVMTELRELPLIALRAFSICVLMLVVVRALVLALVLGDLVDDVVLGNVPIAYGAVAAATLIFTKLVMTTHRLTKTQH